MLVCEFPATLENEPRNNHEAEARRLTERRFVASGYSALQSIRCVARHGRIHLRGCLPSYYLKQLAQSIASEIEGVCQVINEIEVVTAAHAPMGWDHAAAVVPAGSFPA